MGVLPAIDKITNLSNAIGGIQTRVTNFGTVIDDVTTKYNDYNTNM